MSISENMAKPNILWICTDQQRYDTIGYLGNSRIHTPNLDRLCREGVAFTKAYCQNPVCTPSRGSFLTGDYPSKVRIPANGNAYVPEDTILITKILADLGYRCGLCGKLHLASPKNGIESRCNDGYTEFHYSHDSWYGDAESNEYLKWLLDKGGDMQELFSSENGIRRGYSRAITPELHQTTWCAETAIECIRKWEENVDKSPWLLSLNIFDPHPPFDAPDDYRNRYDPETLSKPLFRDSDLDNHRMFEDAYHQSCRSYHEPDAVTMDKKASYYGMIELIDDQIGRILDYLDKSGIRGNTLIIFHSDHGEMLGDHGLILKGARFYEGAVRIPLIFSLPGVISQDKRYEKLVELRDIVPTIKEMIGLPVENEAHSLWPQLCGNGKNSGRDHVVCEYHDSLHPELADNEISHIPTYSTMYRNEQYKLVVCHRLSTGELYDLNEDPDEFDNKWNSVDHLSIKVSLMQKITDHYIGTLDSGAPVIWSF